MKKKINFNLPIIKAKESTRMLYVFLLLITVFTFQGFLYADTIDQTNGVNGDFAIDSVLNTFNDSLGANAPLALLKTNDQAEKVLSPSMLYMPPAYVPEFDPPSPSIAVAIQDAIGNIVNPNENVPPTGSGGAEPPVTCVPSSIKEGATC